MVSLARPQIPFKVEVKINLVDPLDISVALGT
jgi:hypothetical protein